MYLYPHRYSDTLLVLLPLSKIVSCLDVLLAGLGFRSRAVTLDENHANHDENCAQPPLITETISKDELAEQRRHEKVCRRGHNRSQETGREELQRAVEELPHQKVATDHENNACKQEKALNSIHKLANYLPATISILLGYISINR